MSALTKKQLGELAEMVRTTPQTSDQVVCHSVRYNVALFLWGLQSAQRTLEAITLACNHDRPDNILQRIGFEALETVRGKPLIDIEKGYSECGFIQGEKGGES